MSCNNTDEESSAATIDEKQGREPSRTTETKNVGWGGVRHSASQKSSPMQADALHGVIQIAVPSPNSEKCTHEIRSLFFSSFLSRKDHLLGRFRCWHSRLLIFGIVAIQGIMYTNTDLRPYRRRIRGADD